MTTTLEETLQVVDWAKAWCHDNRDRMVEYLVEHYPRLKPDKLEAMIDQLWTRLVNRIIKDFGCSLEEAERAQARGLAFLVRIPKTEGSSSPDQEEDRGWHNFVLYSLEYEAACDVLCGNFIHHLPNDVAGWPQGRNSPCGGEDTYTCVDPRATESRVGPVVSGRVDCTTGHKGSGGDCIRPPQS